MRSKSILVTIYTNDSTNLVLDKNPVDDWDYSLSLNKVVNDYLEEINGKDSIVDVAIDVTDERIREVLAHDNNTHF
jgi:hypothetical protein